MLAPLYSGLVEVKKLLGGMRKMFSQSASKSVLFPIVLVTLGVFSSSEVAAELEEEIPLGLEAVTGMRSEYIHRGFKLSQQVLDFQLEGEVALADDKFLGYGAWYATATGDGDFSETGVKLNYTQDAGDWHYYLSLNYRSQHNSIFDSGLDFTAKLSYFFSESERHSHQLSLLASYDTGAEGYYAALEYVNYTAMGDNAYFSFKTGVSAVSEYYTRDGANDVYGRLSYTYNVTQQVSISPFVGFSYQLDDQNGSDSAFGGLWFEVSF